MSGLSARGGLRRGRSEAFTLLEILLALAVIALLATVLVGTSATLLKDRAYSPDDVFWKACQAARKAAVKEGSAVQLSFDDKTKSFLADDGTHVQSFAIPSAPQDLQVSLLASDGSHSAVLLGGVAVETGAAASVLFYSDGTCTPFRVQFVVSGAAHVLTIDPWTCAKVLTPATG
jgi:Tfp pilus assembly protein FimT